MEAGPTCIIVADKHAARLFLRARPGERLTELHELSESADLFEHHERLPEILRRVGGRTMVKTRTARSREENALFIRRVAARLDQAVETFVPEKIALCAPPDILSLLRDQVTASTRSRIACEICRDHVSQSVDAIDSVMHAAGL